jgi:hypothetical protein
MKAAPKKWRKNKGVIRVGYAVLVGVILLPLVAVMGVTSCLRLGSDATALRNSVIKIAPAKARVVVNVGLLTTGVGRLVAGLFPIPPEAQMAMRSIRAAEVGVYRLEQRIEDLDRARVLSKAEDAMRKRGWDRIVGVSHDRELVAVFMPQKVCASNMRCCVLVVRDEDLVVVSARGKIEEVLKLAREKTDLTRQVPFPLLSAR